MTHHSGREELEMETRQRNKEFGPPTLIFENFSMSQVFQIYKIFIIAINIVLECYKKVYL